MTIYNNGTVVIRGAKGDKERLVYDAFAQHCLDVGHGLRIEDLGDGSKVVFLEDYMGNIDDDFRKVVEQLHKEGIELEGEYKYYGDYDGFALIKDDKLNTYDLEWYTLITGDDSVVIDELAGRGYDVSSLIPQLEERKKEGKDKVVSL